MDWACQVCGNDEDGTRYPVLQKLSDSEQKQVYVCDNCLPHFEQVEYFLQRTDGQLFPVQEQPKWWKNDVPLYYTHDHIIYYMLEQQTSHLDEKQRLKYIQDHALDPARLPFDDFPLVEDFEVSLEGVIAKHNINREPIPFFSARLYSPSLGYLGGFSGRMWSNYLCRANFVIPAGNFTLPYYDLEQGIDLLITEDDQFVYILSGDWESHNSSEPNVWHKIENYYDRWVKIKKERYYEQWKSAIQWSCVYHSREASS